VLPPARSSLRAAVAWRPAGWTARTRACARQLWTEVFKEDQIYLQYCQHFTTFINFILLFNESQVSHHSSFFYFTLIMIFPHLPLPPVKTFLIYGRISNNSLASSINMKIWTNHRTRKRRSCLKNNAVKYWNQVSRRRKKLEILQSLGGLYDELGFYALHWSYAPSL